MAENARKQNEQNQLDLKVSEGYKPHVVPNALKVIDGSIKTYKEASEMVKQDIGTPIKPIVPAVFVYVTDVKKSIDWYCKVLGLPIPDTDRTDIHIFGLGESQCSNIFLRRVDKVEPTTQPLFSLDAPNIEETYQFLHKLNIVIEHKDDEVIWFKDPDGNVLMACSI
ncbi:VOC family protein [Cohnella sp.]|uniref:VOC family protein n=1 Tax=Cohnella sp. TaxID=1883426 RepID=UPI00356AAF0A